MNALYKFCSQNFHFWGFYAWLLIGVKGQEKIAYPLKGWQYRVITSLSPINEPFLSFNTKQKPHIKFPKSGDFENKIYIGRSLDPFSSRPNIKEEKAVWLRETNRKSGLATQD